jgi:pentatricopeptide repeat protein
MVSTVQEVFPNVHVLTEGVAPSSSETGRTTFVVVAMDRPLDDVNLSSECGVACEIFSLSEQGKAELVENADMILTDNYAPIENLLASVVQSHSLARAEDDWRGAIRDAVMAEDYEPAIALAREAVALFPDSLDLVSDLIIATTRLAEVFRKRGEIEEALALYAEAREIDPDSPIARLGVIDCYRDLGRFEDALSLYDGILEFDPSVRYNYATALARLGRYPEAIEQFVKVTQESPEFASAYNNWGNTLLQMGDRQGAREKYEKALQFDPDHDGARQNLDRLRDSMRPSS